MKTESQAQAILSFMQQGYEVTPMDALKRFKCMRLASRIRDIKDSGIEITDRWVTRDDGTRFKAYRIKA